MASENWPSGLDAPIRLAQALRTKWSGLERSGRLVAMRPHHCQHLVIPCCHAAMLHLETRLTGDEAHLRILDGSLPLLKLVQGGPDALGGNFNRIDVAREHEPKPARSKRAGKLCQTSVLPMSVASGTLSARG